MPIHVITDSRRGLVRALGSAVVGGRGAGCMLDDDSSLTEFCSLRPGSLTSGDRCVRGSPTGERCNRCPNVRETALCESACACMRELPRM